MGFFYDVFIANKLIFTLVEQQLLKKKLEREIKIIVKY